MNRCGYTFLQATGSAPSPNLSLAEVCTRGMELPQLDVPSDIWLVLLWGGRLTSIQGWPIHEVASGRGLGVRGVCVGGPPTCFHCSSPLWTGKGSGGQKGNVKGRKVLSLEHWRVETGT